MALNYYRQWSLFLHCLFSSLLHFRIISKVTFSIVGLKIVSMWSGVSIFVLSYKQFVIMRLSFISFILFFVNFTYPFFGLSPIYYYFSMICFNVMNFHLILHLRSSISYKVVWLTHFQVYKWCLLKLPSYFLTKIIKFHLTFLKMLNFKTNCVSLFFYAQMMSDSFPYYLKSYPSKWHYSFSFFVNNFVISSFFIVCCTIHACVVAYFSSCLMDADFGFITGWGYPCLLSNFIWDENHPDFTLNSKHSKYQYNLMMFEFKCCNCFSISPSDWKAYWKV